MKGYLVAVAVVALMPSTGFAASPFDGSWAVAQNCPPTAGDVQGFTWTYTATVRNGAFSGRHSPTTPKDGSILLVGKIDAGGTALLNASGSTGRPEYSVGHVAPGYKYHYHVQAHFEGPSGTGTRMEQRQCDFTFTKN